MAAFIHILHLEDKKTDSKHIQTVLAGAGLKLKFKLTSTRDEFETILINNATDIILSDYRLSEYDGMSALRLAQELYPEIPFIFVSGTKGEEIIIEALTQGATDFVLKDNLSRLPSSLKRALNEAEIMRKLKKAEQKSMENLRFFESMDRINQAIQRAVNLQQMMKDVLDEVLSILECERVFLLYPCDPDTEKWSVPMERSKPGFGGYIYNQKLEIPMQPTIAEGLQLLLKTDGPIAFGPGTENPIEDHILDDYGFRSLLSIALYPKLGKPWQFGINQCSSERIWTDEEKVLVREIGRRLEDALTSLLTQQDLVRNEEFLNTILNAIPVPVFYKDSDGKYLGCNTAFEEGLKTRREDIIGKTVFTVNPSELAKVYHEKDKELFRDGKRQQYEFQIMQVEGELRDVFFDKAPIRDDKGNITGLVGTIFDITDRKKTEEALRTSEERLQLAMKAAEMGSWDWNILTGEVVWSKECLKIYGLPPDTRMSYERFLNAIHPEDRDRIDTALQNAVRDLTDYDESKRTIWPDGSIHWTVSRARVYCDSSGNAARMVGVTIDITKWKNAEELYRASEKRFEELFNKAAIPLCLINKEGKVLYFNAQFERLFGYSREDLPTMDQWWQKANPDPIYRKSIVDIYESTLKQAALTKSDIEPMEYRITCKNGNTLTTVIYGGFISDDELLLSFFDITERKILEEKFNQSQKLDAIGKLAGGVAHDFNNMLGVIIGYTELALKKVKTGDPLRNDLEQIDKAALRSTEIIRQLLAFARKQPAMPMILDLNNIIENILKLLRRIIGEDIDLVWHPGPELWPVRIDPSQIDQILANLSVNAKDAIKSMGKIKIETDNVAFSDSYCMKHREYSPGEYVMLVVSDNGKGMDKETMEKIFEPFFTTKGVGKGTGLGLATVYGIVKQNNGFINVDSKPGHGTTFKIYLPHYAVEKKELDQIQDTERVVHGSETVLVVEDDPSFLQMVKLMLEDLGYSVLATSSPENASIIAAENPGKIDLLLTDVIMPEMTGRDLEKKITGSFPGIRCLFMSGYTGNIIAHHNVLEEGVNFIQKPFSKQKLSAMIREVLDGKR